MIILCGSRGALLGIILIFILYIKRLTIKRKIALIFLILFVYWLAGSFISEHVFQPYTALFEKKYVKYTTQKYNNNYNNNNNNNNNN